MALIVDIAGETSFPSTFWAGRLDAGAIFLE